MFLAEAAVAFHGTVAMRDAHFGLPPPAWRFLSGLTTSGAALSLFPLAAAASRVGDCTDVAANA